MSAGTFHLSHVNYLAEGDDLTAYLKCGNGKDEEARMTFAKFIYDWLDRKVTDHSIGSQIPRQYGFDNITVRADTPLLDCHVEGNFNSPLAIRFNKVVVLQKNPHGTDKEIDLIANIAAARGFTVLRPTASRMTALRACFTNGCLATEYDVEVFCRTLRDWSHLFITPHPSNGLITLMRSNNALRHGGTFTHVLIGSSSKIGWFTNENDAVEALLRGGGTQLLEL